MRLSKTTLLLFVLLISAGGFFLGGLVVASRLPSADAGESSAVVTPDQQAKPAAPARSSVSVPLPAAGTLPDDPMLHCCVAAYASDLMLLDTPLLPHGLSWIRQQVFGASLDHAMWFHRPFRADEWFLYAQHSPSASGARGLKPARATYRTG